MAQIQIRISEEEKEAAREVLDGMGLSFSCACKLFLRQVVARRELPFSVEGTSQEGNSKPTQEPQPAWEKLSSTFYASPKEAKKDDTSSQSDAWTHFDRRKIG